MKKTSVHHLIPRSRGGSNEPSNLKRISDAKHRAWHLVFSNLTPEEAIELIKKEWTPKGGE